MALDYEVESPWTPRSELGPHREADYWALPDEPPCELLFGRLYVTPAPGRAHQDALRLLVRRLEEFAGSAGGWLYFAPVDVRLTVHSVVQPDLVWIPPDRSEILGERISGAPSLAIEVLSPGSARRDRGEKLKLYAESGIDEYWIVDPATRTFDFMALREGRYEIRLAEDGRYRSPGIPGLELDVAGFWSDLKTLESGAPRR